MTVDLMSASRLLQLERLSRELMVSRAQGVSAQKTAEVATRIERLSGAGVPAPAPPEPGRTIDVYG